MNLQKKIIIGAIIIAIGVLGLVFIRSLKRNKALEHLTAVVNIGGGEAKITGRFACLPNRKDATSTPVVGCVLGIRGNDNLNYALDTSSASAISPTVSEDEVVTITGVLVPAKSVLGPEWSQFDVQGVIKVSEINKATLDAASGTVLEGTDTPLENPSVQ